MYSTPQIISTEIIKPSSKTPDHLRKLKLSYLDQIVPRNYVPIIFFYQSDALQNLTNHAENISQKLKISLSKTLTSFYPLAGIFNQENHTFDCNDMGCVFFESQVDACLSDVIKDPKIEQLVHYIPLDTSRDDATLLVKITFLSCGGIAIGVRMSHKIGDGASMVEFMKAWANICRDGELTDYKNIQPIFDLERHFPNRPEISELGASVVTPKKFVDKIGFVAKRFVFDKEKITLLKQMGTSLVVKDPTRVEVISAFIWKHYIEMSKLKAKKNFVASHAVNIRTRLTDVDLVNSFGNCFMLASASSDGLSEFHVLVSKFRKAVREIDNEYIMKDHVMNDFEVFNLISKGDTDTDTDTDTDVFWFSSWTRFPIYEVDYGWGKPIWVCPAANSHEINVAVLMSTRSGDDIEAWVHMSQDNIQVFETQFNNLGVPNRTMADDKS